MRTSLAITVALLTGLLVAHPSARQDPPRPTFRSGVDRVGMTVVVRTRQGRPVNNLEQADFALIDEGRPREILEFRSEPTPATLALLVDTSGSMNMAGRRAGARETIARIVGRLTSGVDNAGLYAFDAELHEVQPMAPAPGNILQCFDELRPYGSTSLYDAIAETGRRMAGRGVAHRAVVALTDGGDNSSHLTPDEVSGIASEIDVPVYVIAIRSWVDHAERPDRDIMRAFSDGALGRLAFWTGGEIFLVNGPSDASAAAEQIVTELRHQYFIGFAPDTSRPGWHPIDLRTRNKDLVVRARGGYMAPDRPTLSFVQR